MSIFERVKQGATDAARKAQQTLEITRLNSQKSSREKEMTKLYTEMGEAMFHAYMNGETAETEERVASCCEQLRALKQDIDTIEDKIQGVKLEKSCGCGKVVPVNVKFCPDCGTRFTEPEPKPEMTMGEIRVICPDCDTENDLAARYCTDCGLEFGKPKAAPADLAKTGSPLQHEHDHVHVHEHDHEHDHEHQHDNEQDRTAAPGTERRDGQRQSDAAGNKPGRDDGNPFGYF
ncbi:zinc ribbon domain-containing protein [Paenibacillus sp. MMS18-CY102]|uniref:zinc ribbon domain-containing protein n=1 Tax=Paenibacillus sp. MMS18-CY102 TaxID=2682849 RepID=UPI0013666FBA|nr:zinc ribbon domain-containing protein [Paenibacillus sp. MMS18-CY102]MWC30336.1 zinc ribbon domain-containing protein [Paenibacillus sp. MMS18-CY102]